MKKTLIALFGISVFAGAGYAAWAYTPVGKSTLAKWLLKKWGKMAEREEKKLDKEKLTNELARLDYEDHELLFRYTLLDPFAKDDKGKLTGKTKQRFEKLLKKIADRKILNRADLSQLDNIVLPG